LTHYKIQVDTPFSKTNNPGITQPFTYSPPGCFQGPYSHVFKNNGLDLYLVHSGGETLLGGNWGSDDILRGFNVREISPCSQKYDCHNGECIPQTKYNSEGIYQSLAECEANCGSSSGCNGECVGKGKISQLQNLANRLKRKNCGH